MIAKFNRISLAVGIPGLILQTIGYGNFLSPFYLLGTILLILGLVFYAMSRGRHPAWGLFGFLSCLGVIVLYFLKDRA